jgi:hypothetical protein
MGWPDLGLVAMIRVPMSGTEQKGSRRPAWPHTVAKCISEKFRTAFVLNVAQEKVPYLECRRGAFDGVEE